MAIFGLFSAKLVKLPPTIRNRRVSNLQFENKTFLTRKTPEHMTLLKAESQGARYANNFLQGGFSVKVIGSKKPKIGLK